jgi:hypothetical protein
VVDPGHDRPGRPVGTSTQEHTLASG